MYSGCRLLNGLGVVGSSSSSSDESSASCSGSGGRRDGVLKNQVKLED